jgi:uracil phosphoribosyltransferase
VLDAVVAEGGTMIAAIRKILRTKTKKIGKR